MKVEVVLDLDLALEVVPGMDLDQGVKEDMLVLRITKSQVKVPSLSAPPHARRRRATRKETVMDKMKRSVWMMSLIMDSETEVVLTNIAFHLLLQRRLN